MLQELTAVNVFTATKKTAA